MAMDLKLGQVVKSKQGRDKGKLYLVYQIISENYVLLVDGNKRTVERPKKKKIKHLMVYKSENDDIIEKLNKKELDDFFIKKSLDSFR